MRMIGHSICDVPRLDVAKISNATKRAKLRMWKSACSGGLACLMTVSLLGSIANAQDPYGGNPYGEDEMYGGGDPYGGDGGDPYGGSDPYGGMDPYGGGGGQNGGGSSFSAESLSSILPIKTDTGKLTDLVSFFSPNTPAKIENGPILLKDANDAYKAGDFPTALRLYHAHMAVEFEHSQDAVEQAQLSRGLRRPVWQLHCGVSAMLRSKIEGTDYNPISANMQSNAGGGGGYGDPYGGGDPYSGGGDPYGGEGGDPYGGSDPYAGTAYGGQATNAAKKPEAKPRNVEMLNKEIDERFTELLGTVNEQFKVRFKELYNSGKLGSAFSGVATPESDTKPARGMGYGAKPPVAVDHDFEQNSDLPMLTPGLVFVGEDESSEMLVKAREAGLDYLFHFDIAVSQKQERSPVQNRSFCRVYDVRTGKVVASSGKFDNYEVMQLSNRRRRTAPSSEEDSLSPEAKYVNEAFDKLTLGVEKNIALAPMPKLPAASVRTRIGSLISAPKEQLFETLSEIRMYQAQGSLGDADVEQAFQIIAGNNGLTLLYGTKEEKLAFVENWLEGS